MSLTLGTGPLSSKPRGHMNARIEGPAHTLYFEPFERRVRAMRDGETVLDTTRGMLLYESNIGPVLYVPVEDVREDLLARTDHSTVRSRATPPTGASATPRTRSGGTSSRSRPPRS
jgi:Domain of unknown function (DUF427)